MTVMTTQFSSWILIGAVFVSEAAYGASSTAADVYSKDQLLSVGASLAAVVLMVIVLGFIARRFSSRLVGNQLIKVLSNMSVGTRERVVLLEVSGTRVLVGTSAGSVSLLHVFDEQVSSGVSQELSIVKDAGGDK